MVLCCIKYLRSSHSAQSHFFLDEVSYAVCFLKQSDRIKWKTCFSVGIAVLMGHATTCWVPLLVLWTRLSRGCFRRITGQEERYEAKSLKHCACGAFRAHVSGSTRPLFNDAVDPGIVKWNLSFFAETVMWFRTVVRLKVLTFWDDIQVSNLHTLYAFKPSAKHAKYGATAAPSLYCEL